MNNGLPCPNPMAGGKTLELSKYDGNKECPTCRKKIVSKRSLRPDPNFDFLISKIWPDRKQYDAELSASMQLFQEQSNVQSLQKSIEEGIKAQAAYRKQRVQGSYDYEKRKRRPPKMADPSAGQMQQGEEAAELAMSTSMVEQVTVSLAPANLDVATDPLLLDSPMDSAENSEEEVDISEDSTNEDSSSLSSESSLSSSSSSMSISTPKKAVTTQMGEEQSAPASPMEDWDGQAGLEQMMDEMRRRGEDLEVELAPSRALLQRRELLPASLGTSHFIRTSSETTIAAIREFLLNLANNQMATPPPPPPFTAAEGDNPNASSDNAAPSSTPLPPKLRPNRFFIVDRRHQLRKLCPTDNLASAFLLSVHWDRHLVIFFDLDPLADEHLELAEVTGEELAKNVGACPNLAELENRPTSQLSTGSLLKAEEEEERRAIGSTTERGERAGEEEPRREEEGKKRPKEYCGMEMEE